MSVIDRWLGLEPFDTPQEAMEWLLAPGTDRRQVALVLMADALKAAGWVVLRDGLEVPQFLRSRGYVVSRNAAEAEAATVNDLRNRGWLLLKPEEPRYTVQGAIDFLGEQPQPLHVFRSSSVPVPQVGECWFATRTNASTRYVRSVGTDEMSYSLQPNGMPVLIKRASWDRWVQKTRARRV